MPVTAPIFSITRGSLHDGPGVRTVAYLKGCAMACLWCHNPEGRESGPQLMIDEAKCIGCGRCIQVCPAQHFLENGALVHRRSGCAGCGRCARACPSGALTLCGEERTPEDVVRELEKDRLYYEASGGGVTFSGGECLLHPAFMEEALRRCGRAGLHTAVETALYVPWSSVEAAIPHTALFLADCKLMDAAAHRRYTGVDNGLILENLRRLAAAHGNILVRVPLIPTVNDGAENLEATARYIHDIGGGVRGIELLRYNPMGEGKYRRLGERAVLYADGPQDDEAMEGACNLMNRVIGRENFVFYRQ